MDLTAKNCGGLPIHPQAYLGLLGGGLEVIAYPRAQGQQLYRLSLAIHDPFIQAGKPDDIPDQRQQPVGLPVDPSCKGGNTSGSTRPLRMISA